MTEESARKRLIPIEAAQKVDHAVRKKVAKVTRGLSPIDIATAVADWGAHMALSPGKVVSLVESIVRSGVELGGINAKSMLRIEDELPPVADRRMQGEEWQRWPFDVLAHAHRLAKEIASEATTGVEGVSQEHEQFVRFLALQIVEALSPANLPLTNPEFLTATRQEKGANLVRGVKNLVDDRRRKLSGIPVQGRESYEVGKDIAITPGKVIYSNRLIEVIQYEPQTDEVAAEPVLIVPAWIMKYYILDLSPHNSLVNYLVGQGKTVFIISWKNPGEEDRDLGMREYLDEGVMTALGVVSKVVPDRKIHAIGYCLGGTLLAIAAAYMAREGDDRLKSMSLFAAQIDFREAGEITTFLGESTFAFLEALMSDRGYLDIDSMVDAFASLRVSDLVHGPKVHRYLLGKDRSLNDLMAWNEDGTRLPHRMHSEYLQNCYLENNLAEARYKIDGRPVCIGDISVPTFLLGTATDHVAPWKSVYKAIRLMNNEVTFVLTTGGHNAGIACGPDHPRRKYQIATRAPGDLYCDPDRWVESTEVVDGSWWPAFNDWLDWHTSEKAEPPGMGRPEEGIDVLRDAPGSYVFG
jgi:polyhydroxyalkanoate synthase